MSLISKDFRLNQPQSQQREYLRIRWALLTIAFVGIGAVVANTDSGSEKSEEIASSELPVFNPVSATPEVLAEEMARDSFSLSLPELQAQQKILDDANNLTPKQWREFKVKSGDNLARLFKRANIKPQQLDELMKSGKAVKTLRRIFPKDRKSVV